MYITIVTEFAKTGLPRTSDLQTSMTQNLWAYKLYSLEH